MTFLVKFWLEPHQEQVDCAGETNLSHLVELHIFPWEEWLKIQQEAYQKLVYGYQMHLTEVKMAEKCLNQYAICCMYISEPEGLISFSKDL